MREHLLRHGEAAPIKGLFVHRGCEGVLILLLSRHCTKHCQANQAVELGIGFNQVCVPEHRDTRLHVIEGEAKRPCDMQPSMDGAIRPTTNTAIELPKKPVMQRHLSSLPLGAD